MSSRSPRANRAPLASPMVSSNGETSAAATGVPQAFASSVESPSVSQVEAVTKTSSAE